jgi:hypothetical protein
MDTPDILARCRELAFRVAPELRERPLYVIDGATSLAAGLSMAGCAGWAQGSWMPLPLRDVLGDVYRGAGPIIALDVEVIAAAAEGDDPERCTSAVMVHELAHILPRADVPEPNDSGFQRLADDVFAKMSNQWFERPDVEDLDAMHDLAFIRRACHLTWRAVEAGYDVDIRDVHRQFGLCMRLFYGLFTPEAALMAGWSFGQIMATPPPAAAVERWEEDQAFLMGLRERGTRHGASD